jgi:hypothetical protein
MSHPAHERTIPSNGCLGIRTSFVISSDNQVIPVLHTLAIIDHHRYPPRPSHERHDRELRGDSSLVDGSWHLDNMYLGMAKDEDKAMTESWQADADGMLLFVSHHSYFNHLRFPYELRRCRPAYSPLSSRHSLRYPYRPSYPAGRVPKRYLLHGITTSRPVEMHAIPP